MTIEPSISYARAQLQLCIVSNPLEERVKIFLCWKKATSQILNVSVTTKNAREGVRSCF